MHPMRVNTLTVRISNALESLPRLGLTNLWHARRLSWHAHPLLSQLFFEEYVYYIKNVYEGVGLYMIIGTTK
jgi:hypothetical protein